MAVTGDRKIKVSQTVGRTKLVVNIRIQEFGHFSFTETLSITEKAKKQKKYSTHFLNQQAHPRPSSYIATNEVK